MDFGRDEGDISGASLPEYVRKQPWYFKTDNESIDHQRIAPFAEQPKSSIETSWKKIQRKQEVVKWKPGCCKNCGSSTHKEQDCMERPKKRNAQVTGFGVASRELSQPRHEQSYEAKHDQYANYDTKRWRMEVNGQFRLADQVRAQAGRGAGPRPLEMQEQRGHTHFRDRQDTAAYLGLGPPRSDDNWVKAQAEAQPDPLPAMHTVPAVPTSETAADVRRSREFEETQEMMRQLDEPDTAEAVPLTKYGEFEDRYTNGHTSVFGSYFCDGEWGYACCRQMNRHSICTNSQ